MLIVVVLVPGVAVVLCVCEQSVGAGAEKRNEKYKKM